MNDIEDVKPRKEAKRLGFKIVYIEPAKIEKYNACYRVKYKGQKIYPPAADKLGIPMNEIWISEKLKDFEKYILYHELREIKYRAEGFDVKTAHKRAVKDEKIFEGDPMWERRRREINIAPKKILTRVKGIGDKTFTNIMKNRPYYSLEGLREVPLIGKTIYKRLKKDFWSMYQNSNSK